ncbi:MAG TPA: hypothetical protein VGQ25_01285 [Gemmatimonadales bacterium]|jgi:hypothetical protein|nr:hypothetical protein [Gemmatimonadales bacterium]
MRMIVIGGMLLLAGCGRGKGEYAKSPSEPPPEVVKALQIPPSPYYIIYSPPVDLAKKKA